MKIKEVSYGRTIELGKFGRGPMGKAWFGWVILLEEGETENDAMLELYKLADQQEEDEHERFSRTRL